MLVELLLVGLLAKINGYKIKYLFRSWTTYPILLVQGVLIFFQFSVFSHTYDFVRFVPIVEPMLILSFLFALFVYQLYRPAIVGAGCIVAGTLLNKFVMAQNGGKMPVYPTLSYWTGYVTKDMLGAVDQVHILGNSATKWKILTDYIDYGYSILSVGDVLIHLFVCLMLYSLIRAVNRKAIDIKKSGELL